MKYYLPQLLQYWPFGVEEAYDAARVREWLDQLGIEVKNIHYLSDNTAVLSLELLANRGDHHAYLGVARELAAFSDSTVKWPETRPLPSESEGPLQTPMGPLRVVVQTADCARYALAAFHMHPAIPSPAPCQSTVQQALQATEEQTALGLPCVDWAHWVGLEYGQPLHLFDAEKIVGDIVVRNSVPGETAQLLSRDPDAPPVTLPTGSIVVADTEGVLCVAGIVGCHRAAVSRTTRYVLVESACFDPVLIRQTAKSLGITTRASLRFERGSDIALIWPAIERLAAIADRALTYHSGVQWTPPSQTVWPAAIPPIPWDPHAVNRTLGMVKDPSYWEQILTRLGFSVQEDPTGAYTATPPSYRYWDVKTPACLLEECARLHGYGALPDTLPAVLPLKPHPPSALHRERLWAEHLAAQGFQEIVLDSFYAPQSWSPIPEAPGASAQSHAKLLNAIDKSYSWLKNNAVLPALELLAYNQRFGVQHVQAFEFTRLFIANSQAELGCQEEAILWGVVNGLHRHDWQNKGCPWDFWAIKHQLESLLQATGFSGQDYTWMRMPKNHPLFFWFHPHRSACLHVPGSPPAVLGQIHPRWTQAYDLKWDAPLFFQFTGAWWENAAPSRSFQEPDEHLPLSRALAFHIPEGIDSAGVIRTLLDTAIPLQILTVDVSDVFCEPPLVRSLTFTLIFRNENRHTAESINACTETLRQAVLTQWSASGVLPR